MSLLKKVKAGLSKRYEASKQQRQERHVRQAALNKDIEKARFEGYRKGTLAKARSEGFRQAKSKPSRSVVGDFAQRTKVGINFMNQDVATVFGDMNPNFGANVFGTQPGSKAIQIGSHKRKIGKKRKR